MQLKMAEYADLCLLNDPVNIEAFRKICSAEYMPHSYRPAVHHPGPAVPEMVCDLAFVGTGFPSRVRFFEEMLLEWERLPGSGSIEASAPVFHGASSSSPSLPGRSACNGLDVLLAGPWLDLAEDSPLRPLIAHDADECLDNEQTADVYRSAKTGINFYRREAEGEHTGEGWACGPREIEMAACGLWFARDPRPESDELFPMLPAFTSPAEASEQIRWAIAHPDGRAEAALKARAAVADRTFTNHAAKLLRLLDRQPVKVSTHS